MRRSSAFILWTAVAATAACGASDATKGSTSLAASVNADQQTNTSAPASRGTGESQPPMTGCLTRGSEPGVYVLRAEGNAGGDAGAAAASYRVVAARMEDLAEHVDRRVSIEGTVDASAHVGERGGTDARQSATPGSTGTAGMKGSAGETPVLRAVNVRRIADECGAGTDRNDNR